MVQVGRKVHVCLLLGRTGLARLTLERILHVGISFSFPPVCEEDGTARKPESEGEELAREAERGFRLALLYLPIDSGSTEEVSVTERSGERPHGAPSPSCEAWTKPRGEKARGSLFFNGCISP